LGAALCALVIAAGCAAKTGAGTPAASRTPSSGASTGAGFSAPPAAPLRSGEHFLTLQMPEPYTPSAPNGGTDEYRCFLIDPKLTSQQYLTGSQFLPQNTAIVHHAIFFRISPDQAQAARDMDAKTPGEGWTCFGDAGIGGPSAWVAHWAPGANETLINADVGYPMPPGSLLVMQVHYNLLATGGKPGGSDQSSIRLRLADGSRPLQQLRTSLLEGPVELPCAADESGPLCDRTAAMADVTKRFGTDVGSIENQLVQLCDKGQPAPGATQRCDHPVPRAATIYAVAGHMHLLGHSISIVLNPDRPDARTLLDIPQYNFDDQAIHPLAQPIRVNPGDTLRVSCTYDVGLRKLLPQLKPLPPRYVVWGDGTSDEMCLGLAITTT
jgi:copper type II ascorbate-dependent monooxygenase-like protein